MEALILNILLLLLPEFDQNDKTESTNSFITLLSLINHAEAMTLTLIDQSFQDFLGVNSTDYSDSNLDLFAYNATERYIYNKFHDIIIYICLFKHSSASYI